MTLIYDQNISRHIVGRITPRAPTAVLSLHTALPVPRLPPLARPVLCLPTSYILLSLQQKKTPISEIPEADRSLARGRPKMADGFHFDRRLQRVASPCAQSLTDVASCSSNMLYTLIAHVFRLFFRVQYDGGVVF